MPMASKSNGCGERMIWAIRRIIRTVAVHSRRLAVEHGITGPQLSTLNALQRAGTLTGTQIADTLLLSPSTIVGVLDRLEEKDLIERRRDTKDRRRVLVTMTRKGRELVRKVPHPLENSLMTSLRKIPRSKREDMADTLERIVSLIGAEDVSSGPLDDVDIQSHRRTRGRSR
ncbi:MAG: MarR family transcriptional regulator [Candidatus Eisenbacteria bacterium]|nr:MarR family transcriptional regulator [Candidatus Eisenbacteria bacterium]